MQLRVLVVRRTTAFTDTPMCASGGRRGWYWVVLGDREREKKEGGNA